MQHKQVHVGGWWVVGVGGLLPKKEGEWGFLLSSHTQAQMHTASGIAVCVRWLSAFSVGTLSTTVLGQVQSPDVDDWSEKVYKFEDRPPRYFDLLLKFGTGSWHSKWWEQSRARQCGQHHLILYWMLLIVNQNEIPNFFQRHRFLCCTWLENWCVTDSNSNEQHMK